MKKFKAVISIFIAVMMLALSMPTVFSASGGAFAVSSTTKGDTVTVTVGLSSNNGMAGVDFQLNYDPSQLEVHSVQKGSTGEKFDMGGVNPSGSSTVKGAFLNTDGETVKSSGALAVVTFKKVSNSASSSSVTVSGSGTDSKGATLSVSSSSTTVNLSSGSTTQKPTTTAKPTTTKPTTTKPTTTKPTTTKPTTTKPTTTEKTTEETTLPGETTTKIISTETIGVKKGNVYQLAKPSSMSGKIVYTSSNVSVASVTNEGVVNTLAKGMTTIKAVSENGVTKTWLLIVGDGSTVEKESTTGDEEESTTELEVIGSVTEAETEEETTEEAKNDNKKTENDETFRLIFGTAAAVAVLIIVIVIASMIRKRRSFVN